MRACFAMAAAAAALIMPAGAARAEGPLQDRFSLDLGSYWLKSDTTVRADAADGIDIGTAVNLEDTFGFDEEVVFRIEGSWRFHKRHKLRLMYFDSQRSANEVIDEHIRFDGTDFTVGLDVRTDLDFEILELAYEYDFLQRDTYELGVSLGVHHVDYSTGLRATVALAGTSMTQEIHGSISTNVPLPVVGLRGNWNFAKDFYLQAHAQYFKVKYEEYDGRLWDLQAGVLWQFSRHFGAGIAYNIFDTAVGVDEGDEFLGHLDWKYFGGQLYVRASF